ncbi:acetyl-CoA acetyltransferase [Candidatus Woesearchaeota archaeon CG10_big_fil_rev_8_21_14_0_10_45_16]|nr:MAG: acetyl-CoA acetyltransferase [Candidatus Woesearchaeota archaeon CG10_big_fil_rev_8_21_14_0_10_45_16]
MNIRVAGTGHTPFGTSKKEIGELMLEAVEEALSQANAKADDVDTIFIANFSSSFAGQSHLPALLASKLKTNAEIVRVESACASGGLAVKEAVVALSSGLYKTALVVGVEKMNASTISEVTGILASAASPDEIIHGATFPSLYALIARQHFAKYGTTEEHLAMVSAKNHQNARKNILAQFKKDIKVEDVLKSKMVASPLKLLDCSPITDGAAAVFLCNQEVADKFTSKEYPSVDIIGIGHSSDSISLLDRKDLTVMPAVVKAALKAYAMGSISPQQIDVAELHDCFTIAEIVEMEDLGLCNKGQATAMITEGKTAIDGMLPINPSGGLKAKGHPVGATGVSQVVEITKQLQGRCGERQVRKAETGLCCNVGGSGATAVVTILKRGMER